MADLFPTLSDNALPPSKQVPTLEVVKRRLADLKPSPKNARTHPPKHIRKIAKSIARFGFVFPILIDEYGNIIAGHGRYAAALLLGMDEVPTICVTHLSEAEICALMIVDNRLTEVGEWNERMLGQNFKELAALNLDFSLDITGFEIPQIDVYIQNFNSPQASDASVDAIPEMGVSVSKKGYLWRLGDHRAICADASDAAAYRDLMKGRLASMVFTDPPYNLRIADNVSGKGAIKHGDFAMACGEMSVDQYTEFLTKAFCLLKLNSRDGAIVFCSIDWRHIGELLDAGKKVFTEFKHLCVWAKDRASQGSFYRSQHELIFVFKNGTAPHVNNIQLGKFGRYRSNLWTYPSAVSLARSSEEGNLLALHPTVKPVQMIADAIMDCSARGDVVVDAFLGSGSTIIAAEKTGRICYGIELDPKYVDVAVRRWQNLTGNKAIHGESGKSFSELEGEANNVIL